MTHLTRSRSKVASLRRDVSACALNVPVCVPGVSLASPSDRLPGLRLPPGKSILSENIT